MHLTTLMANACDELADSSRATGTTLSLHGRSEQDSEDETLDPELSKPPLSNFGGLN